MGDNMNQPEGGRLYIEGQPAEMNFTEFDSAEEVEPLPTVSENIEQTLTLTPEQAAAIIEATKAATTALAGLAKTIKQWANCLTDRMLYKANDNPKWWHLYKHAKKYRTRKKYRHRFMQQLHKKLTAEARRR